MKAEGVDDWLKHWLKMQNRKKRPLTLRNPIEDDSTKPRKDAQLSKGNAKGKQKAIAELQASSEESDKDHTSSGDEASDEENDDSGDREKDSENGQSDEGEKNENASDNAIRIGQDESCLPPSPSTAAKSKKSRFAFLKSLSDDKHYRQLVRILHAAKVGAFIPFYILRAFIDSDLGRTFDGKTCT